MEKNEIYVFHPSKYFGELARSKTIKRGAQYLQFS
jgi:hypothetical protein